MTEDLGNACDRRAIRLDSESEDWRRGMKSMLFVDDHPIYREGLQRSLCTVFSELQIYTAEDVKSALKFLHNCPNIDLCLSDYRLPDGDGLNLIIEARRRFPLIA